MSFAGGWNLNGNYTDVPEDRGASKHAASPEPPVCTHTEDSRLPHGHSTGPAPTQNGPSADDSDRRDEPRAHKYDVALVRVLGPEQPVGNLINAVIKDSSEAGMRLEAWAGFDPGTLIEIESADTLWLGEVCWCRPVFEIHPVSADSAGSTGTYAAGVRIRHRLSGLPELRRQKEAFERFCLAS